MAKPQFPEEAVNRAQEPRHAPRDEAEPAEVDDVGGPVSVREQRVVVFRPRIHPSAERGGLACAELDRRIGEPRLEEASVGLLHRAAAVGGQQVASLGLPFVRCRDDGEVDIAERNEVDARAVAVRLKWVRLVFAEEAFAVFAYGLLVVAADSVTQRGGGPAEESSLFVFAPHVVGGRDRDAHRTRCISIVLYLDGRFELKRRVGNGPRTGDGRTVADPAEDQAVLRGFRHGPDRIGRDRHARKCRRKGEVPLLIGRDELIGLPLFIEVAVAPSPRG